MGSKPSYVLIFNFTIVLIGQKSRLVRAASQPAPQDGTAETSVPAYHYSDPQNFWVN